MTPHRATPLEYATAPLAEVRRRNRWSLVLIRRGQRVTADSLDEAQDVIPGFCWFSRSGAR